MQLFFVLRFDPPGMSKQFLPLTLWRTSSGAYKWRWKAVPSPRPLYGLDRLAARPDARVIVCEGEKAAKAAGELFPASVCVTSPGGAQGAATADWTPLTGRDVRIWPDADKAGAVYATTVAGLISGLADDVEIIDAMALAAISPKGGTRKPPEKWDAADALPEWRDRRHVLCRAASHFSKPFSPPEIAGAKTKLALEPFDSIRIAERAEWSVKRILPKRGVAALYGRYGAFKSFVAFDIAMHVALGRDWADRRVTQAPVVYLCAEGAVGFRKRKTGFEQAHGDLPADVPFHLIDAAPDLGTAEGDLDKLLAAIEGAGVAPGLIVVDTLAATLHGADENSSGMTQFIANANALASRFNCLVLVDAPRRTQRQQAAARSLELRRRSRRDHPVRAPTRRS